MGTSPSSPCPFFRSRGRSTRSFRSFRQTVPRSCPCQPIAPPFFPGWGGPATLSADSLSTASICARPRTSISSSTAIFDCDQFHHRQQDLPVLGQVPAQLFAAFLPHDVIWFLHDGSPFLRFSQP